MSVTWKLEDKWALVPDLPGFGRSINPDHALSIPEFADSAAAFLDEVGVERATIIGNSLGCAILASFAHRHPDRIERAVLVSPAGPDYLRLGWFPRSTSSAT